MWNTAKWLWEIQTITKLLQQAAGYTYRQAEILTGWFLPYGIQAREFRWTFVSILDSLLPQFLGLESGV
jgi:hypothetical protein